MIQEKPTQLSFGKVWKLLLEGKSNSFYHGKKKERETKVENLELKIKDLEQVSKAKGGLSVIATTENKKELRWLVNWESRMNYDL